MFGRGLAWLPAGTLHCIEDFFGVFRRLGDGLDVVGSPEKVISGDETDQGGFTANPIDGRQRYFAVCELCRRVHTDEIKFHLVASLLQSIRAKRPPAIDDFFEKGARGAVSNDGGSLRDPVAHACNMGPGEISNHYIDLVAATE